MLREASHNDLIENVKRLIKIKILLFSMKVFTSSSDISLPIFSKLAVSNFTSIFIDKPGSSPSYSPYQCFKRLSNTSPVVGCNKTDENPTRYKFDSSEEFSLKPNKKIYKANVIRMEWNIFSKIIMNKFKFQSPHNTNKKGLLK